MNDVFNRRPVHYYYSSSCFCIFCILTSIQRCTQGGWVGGGLLEYNIRPPGKFSKKLVNINVIIPKIGPLIILSIKYWPPIFANIWATTFPGFINCVYRCFERQMWCWSERERSFLLLARVSVNWSNILKKVEFVNNFWDHYISSILNRATKWDTPST